MNVNDAQNIVLGAGYVFFDLFDTLGNPTGERYIGDTPGFQMQVQTQTQQVFGSDSQVAEQLINVVTQITRTASITCRNVNRDNLALFMLGAASTVNQTANSVTGETHDVQPGMYYQLGKTAANPVGVRNVSSVSVTINPSATSPTTATQGTDYTLDAATGRIYIVPGGAIATAIASGSNSVTIGVDYSVAAGTFDEVATENLGAKTGTVRYIANNTTGANRDMVIPKANLQPTGNMDWKSRSNEVSMDFNAEALRSGGLAQLYINGRPA